MNIIYQLLYEFFQEEQFNTVLTIITSFLINILQTNTISYLTAKIITSLERKNEETAYWFFYFFVAISITFLILYYFYKYFQNKIMTKLRQWMRHQLVSKLLLLNNENFSETNFTKLNSPINRISSVVFMVLNDIITYLLPNLTFLIIIGIYFLYNNVIFGSVFLLGNLGIVLYAWCNWQEMLKYNTEYENQVNEIEAYLIDMLNNMDKIIYRGQTTNEIDIFSQKTQKSISHAFDFYHQTNQHGSMMIFMVFLILFFSIGYLIFLFFQEKISITIFITFFTILLLYRDKMMTIIQQIPDFIEFMGRSDSVLKHFVNIDSLGKSNSKLGESNSKLGDSNSKKTSESELDERNIKWNKIEFRDITFQYSSSDTPILSNKNFILQTEDNIIGITGLSGNGKSTFAKLLLKMYSPKSGDIFIDDISIRDLDANFIRKNITYVHQSSKLFDKKIMENIFYGCSDLSKCKEYFSEIMKYPKIQELYRNIDIQKKNTGALGENLSGGQRQIVNILSGLVNPSPILILDEPTNALDTALKKEVLELIRDFKKYKKCIIIISHDTSVFSLFKDRIEI